MCHQLPGLCCVCFGFIHKVGPTNGSTCAVSRGTSASSCVHDRVHTSSKVWLSDEAADSGHYIIAEARAGTLPAQKNVTSLTGPMDAVSGEADSYSSRIVDVIHCYEPAVAALHHNW
eukprot:CAMPEP_0197688732 /NCGR_PEP_ID=MMETSP1338-20131121/105885_1 /TAXON_ID=43686 ORGANISM="Pelagodinium beii, Strain RCC1491" /NCGR_SAMPLE_ID=MMETSP1338 /ASSEMBLY_ACC=CAM_ASM_000754 /LENGTH=116 /DNA_ID=CAMNT_0043270981 /DNA_START=88 /DNA_END=435 /DNA_ORIENTATION=+